MAKVPTYTDLASLDEDDRIEVIGNTVITGQVVAFVVEDDAKADRYIRKLKAKFPAVRITERLYGPVRHSVSIKVSL